MTRPSGLPASREQVLAFRQHSHHLTARLPAASLLDAAGACSIQNTPPGSAALSLHARVAGLTPKDVEAALEAEKTLLQAWTLRGAPHVFPARDAAVFTLGMLPSDEPALRAFVIGIQGGLQVAGMQAAEVIAHTAQAVRAVLGEGVLANKQQLDQRLAAWVAERLPPAQAAAWALPSPYGPGQRLGEALVSFALRPVSLAGGICFAPRRGDEASFVRPETWLGAPLESLPRDQARAELLRRYLHCYGPSTVQGFAEWTGVGRAQASEAWGLVQPELVEISVAGGHGWLLERDLPALQTSPAPEGSRFLPPHDPYLQLRDRETLTPEKALQRQIWRVTGSPGVVLASGTLAAIWRPQKRGSRLGLTIEWYTPVSSEVRDQVEAEAAALAEWKCCTSVELTHREAHEGRAG